MISRNSCLRRLLMKSSSIRIGIPLWTRADGKGHIGDFELEARTASGQASIGKMDRIASVVEPNGAAYCRSYNLGKIGCFDTEQILPHVEVGSTPHH